MNRFFTLFTAIIFCNFSSAQIQKLDEDFAYRFNGHEKLYLLDTKTDFFKYSDSARTKKEHYYAENTLFHKAGNFYDESVKGERIKYYKIKIVKYSHHIEVTDTAILKEQMKGKKYPIDFKLFRKDNKNSSPTDKDYYLWIHKPSNKAGNGDNNKTYLIRQTEFEENERDGTIFKEYDIWEPSLGYGAQILVPFKLRPKINEDNLRITPEVQLGGYLSMRFRFDKRRSRYLHLPFVTAGVSGLGINNDNKIDESTNTGEGLVMGTTFTIGSAIELGAFQLGVMMGWDKAGGEIGKDWIYNGRPWYSFGIGFTFLNKEKKEKSDKETKDN